MPSPDLAVDSWELNMRQGKPRCITLSRAEAQSFKHTRPGRCRNIIWIHWRKPGFLVNGGIRNFCPEHKGKGSNVHWAHREAVNQTPPDLPGTGLKATPAHTCVRAVKLFEGTDEIRLVGKKLLPQDFESRALSPPNAVDSSKVRKVTWRVKTCV